MKNSHILFLTLGTKGDLFPFLGIAKELVHRGHSVHFLGSEDHQSLCEAEGCTFEAIQSREEHQAFLMHPDVWKPVKGLELFLTEVSLKTAAASYRAIERYHQKHPSILITNNGLIGGLFAREKLQIPTAAVFLHPYSHVSASDPAKDTPFNSFLLNMIGHQGRRLFYHLFEKHLNSLLKPSEDFRRSLQLPTSKNILGEGRLAVDLILDLWPEWFCASKKEWPAQAQRVGFVSYDGPRLETPSQSWKDRLQLKEFLRHKPIVFTMGSEMLHDFEHQLELFSSACRKINRPGLLVSSALKAQDRFDLSESFKVIRAAPFQELFPEAQVILSHGGIGTVARALAAEKPTVVCPLAFDQFDNGYHVERLGLGRSLPFRSLKVDHLAQVLEELCRDQEMLQRAEQRQNTPHGFQGAQKACDLIEEHLLKQSHVKAKAS